MGRLARTDAEYSAVHYWVRKHLGRPEQCDRCGTTEKRRYHWSNISQEYKWELSDWQRLCVPCHTIFDGWSNQGQTSPVKPFCIRGHPRTKENIYNHPTPSKGDICRTCKRDADRTWKRKKRAKIREEAA